MLYDKKSCWSKPLIALMFAEEEIDP